VTNQIKGLSHPERTGVTENTAIEAELDAAGSMVSGNGLHHTEERFADPRIGDPPIETNEIKRLRPLQQIAECLFFGAEFGLIRVGKKIGDRHAKSAGNCRETGGAHAVSTGFVFLHLLKGEAEAVGEGLLVHPEEQPAHADASADINVDWMRHTGAAAVFGYGRGWGRPVVPTTATRPLSQVAPWPPLRRRWEKLIKIDAKIVSQGRYVTFQIGRGRPGIWGMSGIEIIYAIFDCLLDYLITSIIFYTR